MFMLWHIRTLLAACSLAALIVAPASLWAEDTAAKPADAKSAPADKPETGSKNAPCPHSADGTCCGECQHGQAGEHAHDPNVPCPSKRAKEAQQGS